MATSKQKTSQAVNSKTSKKLKVTLVRSLFGRIATHAECVKALGLRRIRHCVSVDDNACTRGLINKVAYLLKVEEV